MIEKTGSISLGMVLIGIDGNEKQQFGGLDVSSSFLFYVLETGMQVPRHQLLIGTICELVRDRCLPGSPSYTSPTSLIIITLF